MSRQPETSFLQPGLPAVAGADRRRVVEQAVMLFVLGEAGEFGEQRVRRRQERFFAMQDRRVFASPEQQFVGVESLTAHANLISQFVISSLQAIAVP